MHHLKNLKYGINKSLILIILKWQSNSFPAFKNRVVNEILIFLIKLNNQKHFQLHSLWTIACDDQDPPWINNRVKEISKGKDDSLQSSVYC